MARGTDRTVPGAEDGRVRASENMVETEVGVAIELSLFNNSVTTLVNHLTSYYGDDVELDIYVICARVKAPDIPGGSGLNWIVGPNGHEHAPGLLRSVLEALENGE